MGDAHSFKVTLPELRLMFPGRDRTVTDHYRIHAFGWIIKAGLDPYTQKDREVFRDAVLCAIPEEWHSCTHVKPLIRIIRAWNPSLASIERTGRPVGAAAPVLRRFVRS